MPAELPPVRQRPELLAPAGDADSLAAALQAGADAVYFGLDEGLNARARARNFALAQLPATCEYIHRAGALAYLTMNTLVFEEELPFIEQVLRAAAAAGIDALIVQDPAVALLARQLAPTLHVHASTQMTISSAEASKFAAQLGITRVVVPRELSVAEIRRFAQETPLELEVFIHGALCVSWSGQCLTSEAWGGRSANRGQCAQSCRMPYDLVIDGERRELGQVEYLLSPQDLAGIRAVPELMALGIAGLKIEGRQKGPQYVQTAVQGYRRWIDSLAQSGPRQPANTVAIQRLQSDLQAMGMSYTRGFSDGFLGGVDHQDLVDGRFPKHRGLLLGQVSKVGPRGLLVVPALQQGTGGAAVPADTPELPDDPKRISDLSPAVTQREPGSAALQVDPPEPQIGMGVGIDTGHPEAEEPGGTLTSVQADGDSPDGWWLQFGRSPEEFRLMTRQIRPGHRVWLSGDQRLALAAQKAVQAAEPSGRIPVRLEVSGALGQPLHSVWTALGAVGRGVQISVHSEISLLSAAGQGLDEALLRDKLAALGGTPLRCEELDCRGLPGQLHLPVSALKALRRQAVEQLVPLIHAAHRHATDPEPVAAKVVAQAAALHARRLWQPPELPQLVPLVRQEAQLDAVIAAGLPEVVLDWMDLVGLTRAVAKARAAGLRVTIATVRVQKPGEDGFDRRIARLEPDAVLVRHWGGLMHFAGLPDDQRPMIHGDFSLNVTNSVTAHHLLALGADTLTAAHDLDTVQLGQLLNGAPAERVEVIVHHHLSTFHTEHCVYAHLLGKGRDFHSCGRPCEQHLVALGDRVGYQHPVIVDVGCRNTVFNAQAQSAAQVVPELLRRGVKRLRVELLRESAEEASLVLGAWQDLLRGRIDVAELSRRIGAHEQFGVTTGTLRSLATAPRPAEQN